MEQPLTPFQDTPFRYAIQVALSFDNPTLATFRRVLSLQPRPKDGPVPRPVYADVLHKLRPEVREYLRDTYDNDIPRRSRGEILNRLSSLVADPSFAEMFAADETKIDFYDEISKGKVIVINAHRDFAMYQLYGRYFLGLIKQAGEAKRPNPIPCFIYIDECNEFVANDQNAIDIIRKLRRKRIALILGNQAVEDIHSPRQAFLGTRIKLINADEDSAKELAKNMNLRNDHGAPETSQLVGRPSLDFAYHIRGDMREPEQFKVPFMHMENMPKMTEEEWEQVRQQIRDRVLCSRQTPADLYAPG